MISSQTVYYFTKLFILLFFILYIVLYLFFKIRRHFPYQQICWFCHKSQKVSFSQRNSFNCLHCQQYNGFSEDGNYNKVIYSQLDSTENPQLYCQPIPDCYANSDQLCNECNVRQEIKVKLLAEFIPFNELNFTQECDEYKKYLENEYKLCQNCETKVKNVLLKAINCRKDFDRNCYHLTRNAENDSVFVRQNDKSKRIWFIFLSILVLENISLFCAIILFVLALNEYQCVTELTLIEVPISLIQFLDYYLWNQTLLIVIGFVATISAIVINGKKSLQTTNAFCLLLWIGFISTETPIILTNVDKIDLILLRPILSTVLILFSVINISFRLYPLFALFDTNSKTKQILYKTKEHSNKSFKSSLKTKPNVCSNGRQVKNFSENYKKTNKCENQSIGEQIKSLCIVDESDPKINSIQTNGYLNREQTKTSNGSNGSVHSSLFSDNSFNRNIILPAKFNYQSIAQTSWVSPFEPNTSPNRSLRTNRLTSVPYLGSRTQFASTSQWISHHMPGLVTPPPSATESISGESAVNRLYPSVKTTTNSWSPHMFDYKRNSFYNSNDSLLRNRYISGQYYRKDSIGKCSEESYVSEVSGSLSSLTIEKTSNKSSKQKERQSFALNLTQALIFAVFLLILFSFLIFLSLPVVLKTSCDFHSLNFHFTIESLPQNDVCIK